jgi:hypothetical protein
MVKVAARYQFLFLIALSPNTPRISKPIRLLGSGIVEDT